MNQVDTDFSASNLILMIGGQILFIVLALIILFFGTDSSANVLNGINGINGKNATNRINKNASSAPK